MQNTLGLVYYKSVGKEQTYDQLQIPQIDMSIPQRLLPLDLSEHRVSGGGFRVRPSEGNIFYDDSMLLTSFGSSMQAMSFIRDEGHYRGSENDFRAQHNLRVTEAIAQVYGYDANPETARYLANSYKEAAASRSGKARRFTSDFNETRATYQQQEVSFPIQGQVIVVDFSTKQLDAAAD